MAEKVKIALTPAQRTIPVDVMKNIAVLLPNDGFVLTDALVGVELKMVKLTFPEYETGKSFLATYETSDGKRYNLPAGAFKGARVLSSEIGVVTSKEFADKVGVALRSEATEVWDKSSFLHSADETNSMKTDDKFVLPETLKVHSIIIKQTPDGKPRINPFLYNGYREVVNYYRKEKNGTYPSWEDFKEELLKSENRIPGLSTKLTEPTLSTPGRDKELRSMGFNLIFADFEK